MPDFPSTGAIGSGVNPTPPTRANGSAEIPKTNTILFWKRMCIGTNNRTLTPDYDLLSREWEIPFTVDTSLPVSEITERIDTAMDKLGLYTKWKINYNNYTILALQEIREARTP